MLDRTKSPKKIAIVGEASLVESLMARQKRAWGLTGAQTSYYAQSISKPKDFGLFAVEPQQSSIYGIAYYVASEYEFYHLNPQSTPVATLKSRFDCKYDAVLMVIPFNTEHEMVRRRLEAAGNHFIEVYADATYDAEWLQTKLIATDNAPVSSPATKEVLDIVILGKIEEVQSFFHTHTDELGLHEDDIKTQYQYYFQHLGITAFLSRDFRFRHLNMSHHSFHALLRDRNVDAVLVVNAKDCYVKKIDDIEVDVLELIYQPGDKIDFDDLKARVHYTKKFEKDLPELVPLEHLFKSSSP